MSEHTHKHAHLMDQEKREKLQPSRQILRNLGIREGQIIADLGCGYGHFAVRAAAMIGPTGQVKAIDIEPDRMDVLRHRANEQGVSERIETILTHGETIPLPDQAVQIALAANLLHELAEPLDYLGEIRRILKPGGEIWIVEWVKAEMEIGPPLAERRSSQEWAALVEQAGFTNIWVQYFSSMHILLRATNGGE